MTNVNNHQALYQTLDEIKSLDMITKRDKFLQCCSYVGQNISSFSEEELVKIYHHEDMIHMSHMVMHVIDEQIKNTGKASVTLLEIVLKGYGSLEQNKAKLVEQLDKKGTIDLNGLNKDEVSSSIWNHAYNARMKRALLLVEPLENEVLLRYVSRSDEREALKQYCRIAFKHKNDWQVKTIAIDEELLNQMLHEAPEHQEELSDLFLFHHGSQVLKNELMLTQHEAKVLQYLKDNPRIATSFLIKHELWELPNQKWQQIVMQASIDHFIQGGNLKEAVLLITFMGKEYLEQLGAKVNLDEFFNKKVSIEFAAYSRYPNDKSHRVELNALQLLLSGQLLGSSQLDYFNKDEDYSFFSQLLTDRLEIFKQPIKQLDEYSSHEVEVLHLVNYPHEFATAMWLILKNHQLFKEEEHEILAPMYISLLIETEICADPWVQQAIYQMSPETLAIYEGALAKYVDENDPELNRSSFEQTRSLLLSAKFNHQLKVPKEEKKVKNKI